MNAGGYDGQTAYLFDHLIRQFSEGTHQIDVHRYTCDHQFLSQLFRQLRVIHIQHDLIDYMILQIFKHFSAAADDTVITFHDVFHLTVSVVCFRCLPVICQNNRFQDEAVFTVPLHLIHGCMHPAAVCHQKHPGQIAFFQQLLSYKHLVNGTFQPYEKTGKNPEKGKYASRKEVGLLLKIQIQHQTNNQNGYIFRRFPEFLINFPFQNILMDRNRTDNNKIK